MSSGGLYMDALITPPRSLSKRGVGVVVGITACLSAIPFTMAIVMGAPIPPIFLGLDVLGLWLALTLATRGGGRRSERVQVSSEAVKVLRGGRSVWNSPTAFTRVEVEGEEDEMRVFLRLSARSLVVAGQLSPGERGEFAEALKDALREARAERYPV